MNNYKKKKKKNEKERKKRKKKKEKKNKPTNKMATEKGKIYRKRQKA